MNPCVKTLLIIIDRFNNYAKKCRGLCLCFHLYHTGKEIEYRCLSNKDTVEELRVLPIPRGLQSVRNEAVLHQRCRLSVCAVLRLFARRPAIIRCYFYRNRTRPFQTKNSISQRPILLFRSLKTDLTDFRPLFYAPKTAPVVREILIKKCHGIIV